MRAVLLAAFRKPASLETAQMPVSGPREVLVRVKFAPVHPADLATILGKYEGKPIAPCILGVEGSGEVVSAEDQGLVGKKVSFFTSAGTWAEYTVVPVTNIMPLADTEDLRQAACYLINPLTALLLLKAVQGESFVINAGSSALAKALIRQASIDGVKSVAIVRK